MKKTLKKFLHTGVGFISLTAERMNETVKGLIEDGKISEEEGKKIVDDFSKNSDTKKDEIESQFKSIIEKVLKSFNFATKSDMLKIDNRIAVLEALLAKDAPVATKAKTAAKKTVKKETKKVEEVKKETPKTDKR